MFRWEFCLKNVQRIRFFELYHISQCLHTDCGIFLMFHTKNVHHGVFVLHELHFLCNEWMPMVDTFYQDMVVFVES